MSPASLASRLSKGEWVATPALLFVARLLVKAVLEGNKRYLISMPPRHGKSELISRWAPVWALNLRPSMKVGINSYAAALAHELSDEARRRLREHQHQLRVKYAGGSPAVWRTTQGGGCYAAGVDGPVTGRGFDLGLIDDPIKNMREALSPTIRENAWRWYRTDFRTRIEPRGSIVVLQTRWHEDDLSGRLGARYSEGDELGEPFEVFNLPAVALDGDLLGRAPGEALFPARYDAEALERLRIAVGPRAWSALFQGGPQTSGERLFPKDGWVRYSQTPAIPNTVLSVDATFRDTSSSDYVAIGELGFDTNTATLIDVIRRRMTFSTTCSVILSKLRANPRIRWVIIEAKANGDAIIDTLRGKLPPGVRLIGIDPEGGKEARAQACEGFVKAGNVIIPEDGLKPWVKDFVEELHSFPAGSYDDQVDMLTQALIAVWITKRVKLSIPTLNLDPLARRSIWK